MSRHVPRSERWAKRGPAEYAWNGVTVKPFRGQWWAHARYAVRPEAEPGGPPAAWVEHDDRLGPFKRPRNAMVAAEEHLRFLERRHGERFRAGPPG